jgi:hypothetical protein
MSLFVGVSVHEAHIHVRVLFASSDDAICGCDVPAEGGPTCILSCDMVVCLRFLVDGYAEGR